MVVLSKIVTRRLDRRVHISTKTRSVTTMDSPDRPSNDESFRVSAVSVSLAHPLLSLKLTFHDYKDPLLLQNI
jgi:hypothetical protein